MQEARASGSCPEPIRVWLFHHEGPAFLGGTLASMGLALWGISRCPACICAGGSCRTMVRFSRLVFEHFRAQLTKSWRTCVSFGSAVLCKAVMKRKAQSQDLLLHSCSGAARRSNRMADLLQTLMDQSYLRLDHLLGRSSRVKMNSNKRSVRQGSTPQPPSDPAKIMQAPGTATTTEG
jgi:hypothetical protein